MQGRKTRGLHDFQQWETGEEPSFDPSRLDVVPLQELIEERLDNPPKDKRSKDYKEWKQNTNKLMELYNKKVSFQAYQKLS